MTRIYLAVCAALLECGCSRVPLSFAPPEQRPAVEAPKLSMMLEMADRDAAQHFVKDLHDAYDSPWRWTDRQPTVKVLVIDTDRIKLSADLTIWDGAFKQTGPVELTFVVNGKELDRVRYDSPGYKHFEKPVPAGWVAADQEATISATIDKIYVDADHNQYGFILTRIGFVQ